MELAELAARLVESETEDSRRALLRETSAPDYVGLASALKDICYDAWKSEPVRATRAAAALEELSGLTPDPEVAALAAWVGGIAALIDGQMERALAHLDDAGARFIALGKPHAAASTEVSKLIALAMLGRYDEAIECGLRAREVFIAHDDILSAGKIEHNIGIIYFRRDRYREAEQFQLAARERYSALGDQEHLTEIDNCLANIHSSQHKFRSAEQLYTQALERARASRLVVTEAEIECSIGELALFQGRYDRALDYLEQSRRKYAVLGMAHESATVELELADAYLELNLAPEAAVIYERVIEMFGELGMRAEQARALAQAGRAAILLGQTEKAHQQLAHARDLYAAEENVIGQAMVMLLKAQLHLAEGDTDAAILAAAEAEESFAAVGIWRRLLMARWLRGEAEREQGHAGEARVLFERTLGDAEAQAQPQIAHRCLTSLGLLAAQTGDNDKAEEFFKRAVALIEDLRAPLPAEEFRTAFFADKLVPYDELVRLCLDDERTSRASEALVFVERARSRALVDMLGGGFKPQTEARDPFEAQLLARLEELREELNWFYSQINRPPTTTAASGAAELAALQESVRERESETLEITRQLQHRTESTLAPDVEQLDVEQLQRELGQETALVEYTTLDGEWLAFVVTDESVRVVRHLGTEEEVNAALNQLRFQIESLRYGAARMRRHLPHLTGRAQHYLQQLYDLLLGPIEDSLGERRLMIVPHRALHYLPFQALHDGATYLIERREVCYAPSAVVLRHCLARPHRPLHHALLLGVEDEQTPLVRAEVESLAPLFAEATVLLDERATLDAVREHAPGADVLHLACHGQFRPDNPLFSALRLTNGWLSVRDAYGLDLHCELLTLSACETGVSAVAPGDELIGLARGFFSAGAPSLLLSLWTVDDEATAALMTDFYERLLAGASPAAALRAAQRRLLQDEPHPFFWSPFVLVGRW
jgi:CHAT domain-containing protein